MGKMQEACLHPTALEYEKFRFLFLLSNGHQACPHPGKLCGSWPFHLHNDSSVFSFLPSGGESLFIVKCLRRAALLSEDRGDWGSL